MMDRFTSILIIALLVNCASARAQTTLKIATVAPEGSHWVTAIRSGVAEIDKRTDGRVKFKLYTGGIQGNDAQVRRKMRIGQLHGGVFTSGAMKAFQNDAEIYGLPMMFNDTDEVRHIRNIMDVRLRELMEEAGYVNFGFAGGGFAYLMSNTPIRSQADMQGMKIWIPEGDEVARSATKALGISPVSLPLTDVLTGLQTELVDTVMAPPIGAIVLQWHTNVRFFTNTPIAYTFGMLIIDGKAFGKISGDDQGIVREVMEPIYRELDTRSIADNRESLQALLDDGLEQVQLNPGEATAWRGLVDASNRKAGQSGVFDLTLLEEIDCHLAAYRDGTDGAYCAR